MVIFGTRGGGRGSKDLGRRGNRSSTQLSHVNVGIPNEICIGRCRKRYRSGCLNAETQNDEFMTLGIKPTSDAENSSFRDPSFGTDFDIDEEIYITVNFNLATRRTRNYEILKVTECGGHSLLNEYCN